MKSISKKVLSVVLALIMVLAIVPLNSAAANAVLNAVSAKETINFGFCTDIHYYPSSLSGNFCEVFMDEAQNSIGREFYESAALLDSALAAYAEHAKKNDLKYLIIPGDLTSNGEYQGHIELANRLERFEKETGIQVLLINGNHDIVKHQATTYENGKHEPARYITPEEFRETYKNLGYDLAYNEFEPSQPDKANRLSYSVRDGGYRFIMIDTSIYSPDVTKSGKYKGETGGCLTDECLQWVLKEIADAKACGEVPVGVYHHNFTYHFRGEYSILRGFVINDFESLGETLADAGMHFGITGHIHQNDITQLVSDNGEVLNEICCSALSNFPNYIREVSMSTDRSGNTTLDIENFEVDCVKPVVVNGHEHEKPFRKDSFRITLYGYEGLAAKASGLIVNLIKNYGSQIGEIGLVSFLKNLGVDLEAILKGFIGEGLQACGNKIFTVDNILLFVDDLGSQLYENYLANPEATAKYLQAEIQKLLDVQVSDIPATRFYSEYGVGNPNKPGDFEDLVTYIYLYVFQGDIYYEDDPFILDALDKLENGDTVFKLFDVILEVFADDILQNKLLADLEFRPQTLFPQGSIANLTLNAASTIVAFLLKGDISYLNISNKVLGLANKLDIVEYSSLWGIVEHYMDEYLTDTQLEGVGHTLAAIVRDFVQDDSYRIDGTTSITYSGTVPVEATRDNYRLPTTLSVTLGQDQSSRNVSWYTKHTVNGSDIEIIEKSAFASFEGKNSAPDGVTVTAKTVKTTREYPGIDLGVLGIMNYEFPMNRHIVNVSGLEAGKTYLYRVGDASRNWWSNTGSFKIADGGKETSFIHIGDPQSQSAKQYDVFTTLIKKAYEMYDSDFIIDTGDNVDHGDNFKQWKWLLDGASDTLMNTALMSAAGNHEGKGEYAIDKNFVYSNVPEQDVSSGIYFSFDYNNVHVAILNTNNLDKDDSLNDEQVEWLKQDMKASDADWKFVAFHKAMYSNGSHYKDDDVCEIRDELCSLMPELGIDIVFQGHDHVYLRTDAMINNEVESITTSTKTFDGKEYVVKQSPVGTVYVISGCAGVKVYKQKDASLTDEYFPRAEAIENVDKSVFTGVHIVDDTLYFDAYTIDVGTGETENIDSFAIEKDLDIKKGYEVDSGFDFKAVFEKIFTFLQPVMMVVLKFVKQLFGIEFFGLI